MSKGKFSELLTEAKNPRTRPQPSVTTQEVNPAASVSVSGERVKPVAGPLAETDAARLSHPTALPSGFGEAPASLPTEAVPAVAARAVVKRSVGRPPGKRSDENYEQVTLFMRKDVRKELRRLLLDDDARAGQDLSGLVNEIITGWLEAQKAVR